MNEQYGGFIYLHWDYKQPFEAVRGHVTEEEFRAAMLTNGVDETRRLGTPFHCFGRWAQDDRARRNGDDATLYPYHEAGRGRFAMTIALYPGEDAGFKDGEVSA
jgi:hypothetical protein